MERIRGRTKLLIALAAVLCLAVIVPIAVARAFAMKTVSPRSERDRAGHAAAVAPGAPDCRRVQCLALTFDGGPGPRTVPLLRILRREHIHATFFLQGSGHIDRYPRLVTRIADAGHVIGNHTWTHPRLTGIPAERARAELGRTQAALAELTGRRPTLMRPPQGRTGGSVSKICRELGLAQILWSVTTKDYETHDPAVIRERVLAGAHRDGVVLLHDEHPGAVPALPSIIHALRARGYTFVTVPQLMAPGRPRPGVVYRP